MAQSLSVLNKTFISNLKNNLYEGNIPKSNIKDDIQLCISGHNVVISIFDKLEEKARGVSLIKTLRTEIKNKDITVPQYNKYVNGLKGRALLIEEKTPLVTIKKANEIFIDLLKELNKNLGELVKTNTLNIHNTKISHVILLGLLEESKIISQYSMLLTNMVLNNKLKVVTNPPKYKLEYLKEYTTRVSTTISNIFMKTDIFNFLNTIKQLKSTNTDILLLNDDDQSNLTYVASDAVINNKNIARLIILPVIMSPFRVMGSLYARVGKDRYDKNVEAKEWLEAQIQLLRLELDGVSSDDKNALKLQKIIRAYEDMLSKRNRDIARYQES